MSVKGKVKRLNKEIEKLYGENIILSNVIENLKRIEEYYCISLEKNKLYENLIKFFITKHIGDIRGGGMQVHRYGIDKMNGLKLNIEYQPKFNSYIIKVR